MLWGQGVSPGVWQEEGLCSATVPILTVWFSPASSAFLSQTPLSGRTSDRRVLLRATSQVD